LGLFVQQFDDLYTCADALMPSIRYHQPIGEIEAQALSHTRYPYPEKKIFSSHV
jgi:hypothetical protein